MTIESLMKFGHSGESVKNVQDAVMAIVTASCGDTVKIAALEALTKALTVSNISVTDCTFIGEKTEPTYHYATTETCEDLGDDD